MLEENGSSTNPRSFAWPGSAARVLGRSARRAASRVHEHRTHAIRANTRARLQRCRLVCVLLCRVEPGRRLSEMPRPSPRARQRAVGIPAAPREGTVRTGPRRVRSCVLNYLCATPNCCTLFVAALWLIAFASSPGRMHVVRPARPFARLLLDCSTAHTSTVHALSYTAYFFVDLFSAFLLGTCTSCVLVHHANTTMRSDLVLVELPIRRALASRLRVLVNMRRYTRRMPATALLLSWMPRGVVHARSSQGECMSFVAACVQPGQTSRVRRAMVHSKTATRSLPGLA